MGQAVRIGVEHEVDLAPGIAVHGFRAVPPGVDKPHRPEQSGEFAGVGLAHREFDEADALGHRSGGQGPTGPRATQQRDQRALAIGRDLPGRAHAEAVREDLVADPAIIARRAERRHEPGEVHLSLAGKAAVVPRELHDIHVDARRVRDLDECDAVGRHGADRLDRVAGREDVKCVDHQTDGGMVGAAHDFPGVAPVADVAAPGQRLVADGYSGRGGELAELAQISGRPVDAALGRAVHAGADEEALGAQPGRQLDPAPRPLEGAGAQPPRHALEVAQRLQGDDLEPQIARHRCDLLRRPLRGQYVRLEEFHALKSRRRDRLQLVAQEAAHRHRGDRGAHQAPAPCAASAARNAAGSTCRPEKSAQASTPWWKKSS